MATLKVITPGAQEKYRDFKSYEDVIGYIQNPLKTIHGYIGGIAVNPAYAAYEMQCLTAAYHKDYGGHLRHMILTFTPQEVNSPDIAHAIAHEVASYYGQRFQITWGVHENTGNLHVHFAMNRVSYQNGKKYEGQKEDYYTFQDHVKAILRAYGIHSFYRVK